VGLRGDTFDLRDGDHWQKPDEQKETGEEQTKGSDIRANVHIGWSVVAPTRGQEIAVQPDDNNNETFEPHPHIHQERNNEHEPEFLAAPFEPENLRHQDVAAHHEEPGPLIRAEGAIEEVEPLVWIAAIPSDKKLHRIGVPDN